MNIKNFEDLDLDEKFYDDCIQFKEILKQWGKIHNLSAELEDEKIERNILDSVFVLKFLDLEGIENIADIGTGAGYPGLILAMAKRDKKFYLIEPRAKRVAFLNFVKNSLNLSNVEIICDRVENVEGLKVDLVTSRAVTNTALLLDITKNIVEEKTSFLFYKGSMLESEIEEAKIKKYKVVKKDEKRNYLYIKKG